MNSALVSRPRIRHPATRPSRAATLLLGLLSVMVSVALPGCATAPPDRMVRSMRAYVYYLDGAGGGTALSNWSNGIREGLRTAGYPGWGEMFSWETGLGVAPDQVASNEYKRARAAELARKIVTFRQEHPNTPITLIGFSAGTVLAVFTLEALPDRPIVENVVLLSGSLSTNYDLTKALARVRQRMYIFTSERDAILTVVLPISGPADRGADTNVVIGVSGATMPVRPSPETERQYAKVTEVRWNPSFSSFGNRGSHMDAVNEPFVRAFVAPLVFPAPTRRASDGPALGRVRNPDYQCWAPFAPGSWAVLEGTCTRDAHTYPCRVKSTLVSRTAESAVIERELTINNRRPADIPFRQRSIVVADIESQAHPLTHPLAQVTEIGQVEGAIEDKSTKCDRTRFAVPGNFDFWGDNIRGDIYTAAGVPGYLTRIELRTTLDGKQYEFMLQATDYFVAAPPVGQPPEKSAAAAP